MEMLLLRRPLLIGKLNIHKLRPAICKQEAGAAHPCFYSQISLSACDHISAHLDVAQRFNKSTAERFMCPRF